MQSKSIQFCIGVMLVLILLVALTGCSSANFVEKKAVTEENNTSYGVESVSFVSEAKTTAAPSGTTTVTKSFETDSQMLLQARSIPTDELENFQYLLYTPKNPTDNMPLIVYLHGASGKGEDLNLLTTAEDFPKYLQAGDLGEIEAYVIMPQLSSSQKGWGNIGSSIYSLIQETVSEFSIDENNISLVGFSMGGTAAWDFAAAYPTLFARIAPLAGSARGVLQQASVLKEIPVWTFVGSADTVIKPNSSKEMVYALKKEGGTAAINVFDGADHLSVPPLTWLDETINLVDWLIGTTE